MLPKDHFLFGLIFSSLLFIIFPKIGIINTIIILLSSIFIDVDHYFFYAYKYKEYSLMKAYSHSINTGKKFLGIPRNKRGDFYSGFYIFHGIEIILLLVSFSVFFQFFFFVAVGIAFHLLLDITHQTKYSDRIDKISPIADYFKFRKLNFFE